MQGTGHLDALSLFPVPTRARIIFVDDDELVLRSIRRLLRGKEKDWDLVFLSDGHLALRELDRAPVDVIVSDVQMATMGGSKLLATIQERHPDVARIVLSGETDPSVVYRTVPFAHQYLTKPFDATNLTFTLRRACALRSLLTNAAIRAVVGRSNELPAAPATYIELTQALKNPDTTTRQVAAIVERDIGIAARVLSIVSSSFFGAPRSVSTIAAAVGYLGLDTVRTLVLACEIVRTFTPTSGLTGFSLDEFEEHGLRTGRLARSMLGPTLSADDAFVAGLLHRVGQLVLASRVPHRFAEVLDSAARTGNGLLKTELEVLGVTHAQVGAYLLGLWGLRQRVVEAVAYHPYPERLDSAFGIPTAVHVASILAKNPRAPAGVEPQAEMQAIPMALLERQGVADQVPEWRELAEGIPASKHSTDS
ncbi:MAG TPA: response regulator [Polyangiaceae bacterium]|jgi:HD-like signal output (HDOD) protein|nr:response regulator [Polyangiaceae bacterium]